MSMEQVRAQRTYLDAVDTEREATEKIAALESELERWQQIRQAAQAAGAAALEAMTGGAPPEADNA